MASRMTEKGYQWGVKALQKKRAEIAGEIAQLQIQVRHRRRDLKRVDDILRILAPGSDPATIATKKPVKYLNLFRQGELGRVVLGVLRDSRRPMTNLEISRAVMERGGYEKEAWTPMRRRVRANLAYLHDQGRVVKRGYAQSAFWTLPK